MAREASAAPSATPSPKWACSLANSRKPHVMARRDSRAVGAPTP
jgi:hypothetical protein